MKSKIEIRDKRIDKRFTVDNVYIDKYMNIIGKTPAECHRCSAIYMILCRHANNETGEAFPSQHKLKELLNLRSQGNITKYIQPLIDWNIISVRQEKSSAGKNYSIYTLLDKSMWKNVRNL